MSALLDDILQLLVNASVVDGSTQWTGVKSYMPPDGDKIVGIFETGGEEPDQTEGVQYDAPSFQVRIRGAAFDYQDAREKAKEVFDALNDAELSGYVFIFAVSSGPLPLGFDESNRPELSWNFRTLRERP